MEFSEFEQRRIEKIVNAFLEKRRPPADLRKQLDLGFRLEGQGLDYFEIRPVWNDPNQYIGKPGGQGQLLSKLRKIGGFSGSGPT